MVRLALGIVLLPYAALAAFIFQGGDINVRFFEPDPPPAALGTQHRLERGAHVGLEALQDWSEVEFDSEGNIVE